MTGSPLDLAAASRAQMWWAPKLMPLLAAGTLAALLSDAEPSDSLVRLAAMVLSAIGLAAASHLINDWADIESDAAAGKYNAVAGMAAWQRFAMVTATLTIGLAPWALVRPGPVVIAVLALLVAMPFIYSARPIRLKGRGILGVLGDAVNAHVAPTAFAFVLLSEAGERTTASNIAFVGALAWALGFGVRGILIHQSVDRSNDEASEVATFVIKRGRGVTVRLGWAALGVELAGLVAILVGIGSSHGWLIAAFAALLVLWVLDQRRAPQPFHPVPEKATDWVPLAEFYEVWPLVLFTAALLSDSYEWWPLVIGLLLGFASAIRKQVVDLAIIIFELLEDAFHATILAAWQVRKGAVWLWWRIRAFAIWMWWRIHNAATWIWWKPLHWLIWKPLHWLWWKPLNWIWWHPLGWVRFRVLRKMRGILSDFVRDVTLFIKRGGRRRSSVESKSDRPNAS